MRTDPVLLPHPPDPDFDALLRELGKLSRNHLLFFRIEVGRRLSKAFYDHDSRRYRGSRHAKDSSFHRFVQTRAGPLRDLGLEEQILRQSLLVYFVVKELPHELVNQLVYSHVVELTRVDDGSTRELLARAAVDNAWSGPALANAVLAVRAGRWPDADPKQPGLQAPAAADEADETPSKVPQAGRVVNRFERAAKDFEAVVGEWGRVPVEKLTDLQRVRVREIVGQLEGRVAALKAQLT